MMTWQAELAESFTDPSALLNFLGLDAGAHGGSEVVRGFPFRVTRSYARRMQPGNPADPLLRQVLPLADELRILPGFGADPVGDLQSAPVSGVLHKYHGRALLLLTGACAIACRYCFRREFPYADLHLSHRAQAEAFAYLAADTTIEEIILSGGDPLTHSDRKLAALLERIADLGHIRRVRVHSRLPVVLPTRVTAALSEALTGAGLPVVMVIHANHPNELDDAVGGAVARLRVAGVHVLNQSVLLQGVNDDPDTLVALSEALFRHGVLPYYLHVLDKARGTAHFDVPEGRAREIHEAIRLRLPGYLVPRLVREQAGEPYKMPL